MKNNQNLFFAPEETGRSFSDVLKEVQEYISSKYSTLMTEGGNEEVKQQIKRYITKYICDYRITVTGKTQEQLIDELYTEMAEFSFLTKYIFGTGIEEIDINSWRDIEVQYNDGRCEKLEEHFESPDHAVNVIRRMLHVSGMVLDNASPAVLGHLSKNIRIAVLKTPLVDEDVGIAASIRIVNPQSLKKENFVESGTATEEMLDFLSACLRYGISICVAGATSSGKTTLAGWLLTTIPDGKRIFTIENGSRELALVREKEGKVTNSVIHTLTRYSENEKQNIDQDMLLDMALRFNPEIICVGEMRSSEAYTAQESARTGHTVLTTIHSNSCESTYSRMRTLCKRKYDMDDEVLMDLVTEAFPIVVFTKQLENRKRKLMEIMECEITADGKRKYNPLYRYEITENRMEGDQFIINGIHKKVCGERRRESMLTLQMIACIGMIVGAFLLLGIRLNDFTGNIFRKLLNNPRGIREEILEETKQKKKAYLRREIEEVQKILHTTGREDFFPMLCTISLLLFAAGAFTAVMLGNVFLIPVLAGGFLFLPFWYVKLTASHFKKDVSAELETALSIITTAYLRSEDILTSIEENLAYLNPPVKNVFADFVARVRLIDPDLEAALDVLKETMENEVFQEWVDAMKACLYDRSLKTTLTSIVAKLSDMRIVNAELEYLVVEPRKEFITMVVLAVGNIPLLYFLNPSWYDTLMHTIAGQIMLAVTGIVIFISAACVIKLTKPIEYRT